MATLERRVEALEQVAEPGPGFTVIAVQIVSPDNLKPENRTCKIDGLIYTRGADELPADFDSRMMAVADGLNRQTGRLVHLVLSPDDLTA